MNTIKIKNCKKDIIAEALVSQEDYDLEILNAGAGIKVTINEVIKLISNNFHNKTFFFSFMV